ncbi:chromatin remodelling complex Rsc7/Swp82 subunit-domain-containing protein [Hypoxylon sp. FL1284]|nr:chromatin remodelling complex Rsc7/Swp82 subunit-domain-containing protein [Hypoxylon sp. FL1284]
MYPGQPNGAGSDRATNPPTINPAALNSGEAVDEKPRGQKRSHSPDTYHDAPTSETHGDDVDSKQPRKRGRPMKSRISSDHPEISNQTAILPPPHSHPSAQMSQPVPPHTPQSQNAPLPGQHGSYVPAQASPPAKTTPAKTTLKALPTVRDHTTDQLGPGGDEYLPREIDESGEKKVMPNGQLLGGREYRCRTFLVPNRADKLFMLATECARVLGYRDSYLLFNKNRSLFKIIANQVEKDDLVAQEILPFSYRSRQIAIVTAHSMFRQFGSRVIVNGRRVRDDYWEQKARKQGFTEADLAGEKRPGASKAREAAAEANLSQIPGGPHGEIVYAHSVPFAGIPQPLVQPDPNDTRTRDYSNFIKGGPRQEITGPAYQDRTQSSPISEIHQQAHHAAEFNRSVNQQREIRNGYMDGLWRRHHEQPPVSQPVTAADSTISAARAGHSPHTTPANMQASGMMPSQSPPMMMTAPPYSQTIHSQQSMGQNSMRAMPQPSSQKQSRPPSLQPGVPTSMSQGSPAYSYSSSNQMWGPPQTPQTAQHYPGYTTQSQPSPHPQHSPVNQLRHSGGASQMQPNTMQYHGMQGLGQGYPNPGPGMYPPEQTPRQFMPQNTLPQNSLPQGSLPQTNLPQNTGTAGQGPPVTSPWSNTSTSAGGNWWQNQQNQQQ